MMGTQPTQASFQRPNNVVSTLERCIDVTPTLKQHYVPARNESYFILNKNLVGLVLFFTFEDFTADLQRFAIYNDK